jgi:hypothetical protein
MSHFRSLKIQAAYRSGRGHDGRAPIRQSRARYFIQYGSWIFKLNIAKTAIAILATVSSLAYLAI